MENGEEIKTTNASASWTPTDDDDAITTSTESEAFGTWTLVNDKKKAQLTEEKPAASMQIETGIDAIDNRVEELKKDDENSSSTGEEEVALPHLLKSDADSALDDLSDGISIISESDSAGRISPHPFLVQHLNDLNLKFATGNEYALPMSQEFNVQALPMATAQTLDLRKRRRKRSSSSHSDKATLQAADIDAASPAQFHPLVRTGLTGLFYVGVLLAVLAFIGKLRNPEWETLSGTKSNVRLEQKLNDLELQNNLMRAEIDILSKQVNYLTNRKEYQRQGSKDQGSSWKPTHQHEHYENEKEKQEHQKHLDNRAKNTFNEKSYKCPADSLVDGKCIEMKTNEKMLDEDALEQLKIKEDLIKVAEEINKFAANPQINVEAKINDKDAKEAKFGQKPTNHKGEKNVDRKKSDFNKQEYKERHQHSRERRHHDDDDEDEDDSKERFPKQRYTKNSKNEYSSKERLNNHEKQHTRTTDENNSKENSGQRFKEHNQQQRKAASTYDKDGHWHEKLMQHRENARRNNERQRNEKNWYFERSDGREQIRHVDHRYR